MKKVKCDVERRKGGDMVEDEDGRDARRKR